MAIISLDTTQTGQVGVLPSYASINTSDPEATVLTTGYLNKEVANGASFSLPCIAKVSTQATPTSAQKVGWYNVTHVAPNWSLTAVTEPGDVVLPTLVNHFIASLDVNGTLGNLTGTIIQSGSIQAGFSGLAGTIISYSGTASKGSLILSAVANTGDTITTISNAAMGQASVISIPDPAASTADFVLAPSALVNGNLIKASGTAGLVVDAGILPANIMLLNASNVLTGSGQITLVKANGTEASNAVTASGNAGVITTSSLNTAGAATYAITWTNTKITTTSVVTFTIQGGTNTTQNITFTCVPGGGTATLTIYNNTTATALNGTILIGYTVL